LDGRRYYLHTEKPLRRKREQEFGCAMKLILESTDTAMLMARSALLEARGIPTHLDEVAHVGVVPQHLYIMLDQQFADARAVLEDEAHEVADPVYPEDMEALAPEFQEQARETGNQALNRLAIGIVALFLAVVLIAWIS